MVRAVGDVKRDARARLALAVWAAALIGIAVHAHFFPNLHSVFGDYRAGSEAWWEGRDPYEGYLSSQFRYSPLFAIAVTPFAWLPEAWGVPLWKLVGGILYLSGLFVFLRDRRARDGTREGFAAELLLALPLSAISLYNGQANLLMLAAILFGLAAAARRRWLLAGTLLALAALVKGYPLALATLVAPAAPAVVLPFVAGLAGGLALPFLTQSAAFVAAATIRWLHLLLDTPTVRRAGYHSFDQLLRVVGIPLGPSLYALLAVTAGAGALALCVVRGRNSPDLRERLVLAYAVFAVWAVLFGPAAEPATYILLAPALAPALARAFERAAPLTVRALLLASYALVGPLSTDVFGPAARRFVESHGGLPFGALLFGVVLVAFDARKP
jgi:hypothetical protein